MAEVTKISIVRLPTGEAPLWVREAWIGVELPIARKSNFGTFATVGVLSGPKSWGALLWHTLLGRSPRLTGYPVVACVAVDLLAESNPDAADWWRTNAGHLLRPGRRFVFNADACRPGS